MMTNEIGSTSRAVDSTPSTPLSREDLYKLVWSEPMLKVAARYDVSSSYMARVCALLNVPRPERGYWNKLAVGKAPPIRHLPEARPGDELVWGRDGQRMQMPRPLPRPPSSAPKQRLKSVIVHTDQHQLVKGAKLLFEAGRLSHDVGYLKPNKKLLPDLIVTKQNLDKALSFANCLFLLLEEYGYRVVIAPQGEQLYRAEVDEHEAPRKKNYGYNDLWHPWRCTVVYIGTVAIGLTIIEMSEEVEVRYVNGKYIREKDYIPPKRETHHTWTTTKDFPTGKLCLQAFSPYQGTKWVKRWHETANLDLSTQIKGIIKELEQSAVEIARLAEEAERQAEIQRRKWEVQQEQWRKEEAERKAVEALKESKSDLLKIIDIWNMSNRLEQFFLDVEQRTNNLMENEKLTILERLKLARKLVGSIDALDHFLAWKSPDER
jgi:hypothetical protein